ncbi:MAG: hypothetical protein K8S55_14270, partial [Phycisphaerae bacterium]|nr:hypothetical protein [Phycisphaerae bacterium]
PSAIITGFPKTWDFFGIYCEVVFAKQKQLRAAETKLQRGGHPWPPRRRAEQYGFEIYGRQTRWPGKATARKEEGRRAEL